MRRISCQGPCAIFDYLSVAWNEDNPIQVQEWNCEIDDDNIAE